MTCWAVASPVRPSRVSTSGLAANTMGVRNIGSASRRLPLVLPICENTELANQKASLSKDPDCNRRAWSTEPSRLHEQE